MHAVVFMFQIFKDPSFVLLVRHYQAKRKKHVPFEAEAKRRSSELRLRVRTSVLCPGISREKTRVASGGSSLDFEGWGTL
jgi:hypothetical protein